MIKNIRFFNFIIFEKFDFYLKIKIHFPKFRIFLVCFWSGNSKIRREIIKKSEFWGNLSCKSKKTFFEKVFYDFKVWNFLTHGVYGRKFLFLVSFRKLKIKKLTHLGKAWNSGHPSLKFLWNNSAKSLRFVKSPEIMKIVFLTNGRYFVLGSWGGNLSSGAVTQKSKPSWCRAGAWRRGTGALESPTPERSRGAPGQNTPT